MRADCPDWWRSPPAASEDLNIPVLQGWDPDDYSGARHPR